MPRPTTFRRMKEFTLNSEDFNVDWEFNPNDPIDVEMLKYGIRCFGNKIIRKMTTDEWINNELGLSEYYVLDHAELCDLLEKYNDEYE